MVFNKKISRDVWNLSVIPKWLTFNLLIDSLKLVSVKDMTDQQKIDNPTSHITEGFLLVKKSEFTDEVYKKSAQKSWDNATHDDKMLTYSLPNFDADIAQEIFGIDFKDYFINMAIHV